jgi:hypothetical protein
MNEDPAPQDANIEQLKRRNREDNGYNHPEQNEEQSNYDYENSHNNGEREIKMEQGED